jgi:leader peptidase (prepilin peptidase)/N-methyltransferase
VWLFVRSSSGNRVLYLNDLIIARPGVLAFWVFVIGSAVGSFLNVVIYRLPRGMSLSHPGSHCPKCGHAIRWYHNLPIAGWLLLRGKCHDCKAAISPRYPLVELTVAVIFVALAYVDVYLLAVEAHDPTTPIPNAPDGRFLGLALIEFGAHAWLVCSVMAAGLIRWDGQRVPWRLVVPGIAIAAAVAPLLEPARGMYLAAMAAVLLLLALFSRSKNPRAAARG